MLQWPLRGLRRPSGAERHRWKGRSKQVHQACTQRAACQTLTAPHLLILRTYRVSHTAAVLEPKELKEASIHWFLRGEAEANSTEMLFFAFMIVRTATSVSELNIWAEKVVAEAIRAENLKAKWKPLTDGWGKYKGTVCALFKPMDVAYNRTWETDDLDKIGVAIQY